MDSDEDILEMYRSDEPATARAANGLLAKYTSNPQDLRDNYVDITLDGIHFKDFPVVVLNRDERGLLRYRGGVAEYRFSTVYDVAKWLVDPNNFTAWNGRTSRTKVSISGTPVDRNIWTPQELNRRIPILCHREYLDPVAACRMCSVVIDPPKDKNKPARKNTKTSAACQHRLMDNGYVVHTCRETDSEGTPTEQAQRLRKSLDSLTSLLVADRLNPGGEQDLRYENELFAIADLLNIEKDEVDLPAAPKKSVGLNFDDQPAARKRELPMIDPKLPYSSRAISVDHDNCIMCDRCVRSCRDIKGFSIIGHTGKGSKTRISFDLDQLMSQSDCVQCGECMTVCPTGALIVRYRNLYRWDDNALKFNEYSGDKSLANPYRDFKNDLPSEFLSTDEIKLLKLVFDDEEARRQADPNAQSLLITLLDNLNRLLPELRKHPERWNSLQGDEKLLALQLTTFHSDVDRTAEDVMRRLSAHEMAAFHGHFHGLPEAQVRRVVSLFLDIPYQYLHWVEGSIRVRRDVPADTLLCQEGDFGSTAFLLLTGAYWLRSRPTQLEPGSEAIPDAQARPKAQEPRNERLLPKDGERVPLDRAKHWFGTEAIRIGVEDLILGEMACLTSLQRTKTMLTAEKSCYLEVTRNILNMLQRVPSARRQLERIYEKRAIEVCLHKEGKLYDLLSKNQDDRILQREGVVRFLMSQTEDSRRVDLRRFNKGEILVKERFVANQFYIIRYGFVKIVHLVGVNETEHLMGMGKPGDFFGETGLLSNDEYPFILDNVPEVERGHRSATVVAFDEGEALIIPGTVFRELCRIPLFQLEYLGQMGLEVDPETNEGRLPEPYRHWPLANNPVEAHEETLGRRFEDRYRTIVSQKKPFDTSLVPYVEQGLYQGQKLLVLDLLSCTRCDECTRGCIDSHNKTTLPARVGSWITQLLGGEAAPRIPRMARSGNRFGDFLVATSCRSCHQPHCMEACPVDAIHRTKKSPEIRIEDNCIGCGLCERLCPYGSIHMRLKSGDWLPDDPRAQKAETRVAINCDLCNGISEPYCVASCPHHAAFRWSGEELQKKVDERVN